MVTPDNFRLLKPATPRRANDRPAWTPLFDRVCAVVTDCGTRRSPTTLPQLVG